MPGLRLRSGDPGGGGGPPSGPAGGDLAGTYPNPEVAAVHETSGPTQLTLGAVADGQVLARSGAALVGVAPPGGPPSGPAGGQLFGTYPNPAVIGLLEASGPTALTMGAVVDGQALVRSGAAIVSQAIPSVPAALPPNGPAGGQLGGTYPNPDVRGLRETTGPTLLTMGAVAIGQMLVRSGSTLIGAAVPTALPPNGAAGGQLGGTYPNPDVRGLRETTGPTLLTMGAVADGQVLVRSGSNIVGTSSPPSGTKSHAWLGSSTSETQPSGTTEQDLEISTTARETALQDFTLGAGVTGPFTYTGPGGVFLVAITTGLQSNANVRISIRKNSTNVAGGAEWNQNTSPDYICTTTTAILTLATNDTVWFRLKTDNGSRIMLAASATITQI